MKPEAPLKRKRAFKVLWPVSRAVRRFHHHNVFAAYLETVQDSGMVINWPAGHIARISPPAQ